MYTQRQGRDVLDHHEADERQKCGPQREALVFDRPRPQFQ